MAVFWQCGHLSGPARRARGKRFPWSGLGSGGEARTHDPLINSQLLCQLSYPGLKHREDTKSRPRLWPHSSDFAWPGPARRF